MAWILKTRITVFLIWLHTLLRIITQLNETIHTKPKNKNYSAKP